MPRQQTLRATMEWSYAPLNEQERATLRRLAMFSGGCTEAAAISVCGGEDLPGGAVPTLLRALVRKSVADIHTALGDAEAAAWARGRASSPDAILASFAGDTVPASA